MVEHFFTPIAMEKSNVYGMLFKYIDMSAAGINQGNSLMNCGKKMEITYLTNNYFAVWFTV
jgi:hypothetical protein